MNKLINGQSTFLMWTSQTILKFDFSFTPCSCRHHRSFFSRFLFIRIVILLHYYLIAIIVERCFPVKFNPTSCQRVVDLGCWIVSFARLQFARSPPRTNMNKDDDMFEFNAPTTITRLCDMANTYDDGADQIFGKSFATQFTASVFVKYFTRINKLNGV